MIEDVRNRYENLFSFILKTQSQVSLSYKLHQYLIQFENMATSYIIKNKTLAEKVKKAEFDSSC